METTKKNLPATLIEQEVLSAEFKDFPERINSYATDVAKIEIKDESVAVIAKTSIDNGKLLLDQIETVRKTLKQPYLDTGKQIDSYAKLLQDKIKPHLDTLKAKMTSYLQIQKAVAEAQAESERKALEVQNRAKNNELEAYDRISNQLHARLYGGSFKNKEGKEFLVPGCKTVEDCDKLQKFVKENFPDPEKYSHIKDKLTDLKNDILVNIAKVHATLVKGNAISLEELKLAEEAKILQEKATLRADLENEEKKEEKKLSSLVNEAKKGLRKTLIFEVEDEKLVPVEYKTVDNSKIKSWQSENKEAIKRALDDNKQPIQGIRFSYKDIYTNR